MIIGIFCAKHAVIPVVTKSSSLSEIDLVYVLTIKKCITKSISLIPFRMKRRNTNVVHVINNEG